MGRLRLPIQDSDKTRGECNGAPLSNQATQPEPYISKPEGQGAVKRITLLFAADADDCIAQQTLRVASFFHTCITPYLMSPDPR